MEKTGDIANELPIKDLEHLKEVINFFTNYKTPYGDFSSL